MTVVEARAGTAMKMAVTLAVALLTAVASTVTAGAQTTGSGPYVDVNAGAQPERRTVGYATALRVLDEPASAASTQTIGGGAVFDVGVGYRRANRVALGVSVSAFSRSSTATLAATVPDPVFYNAFTTLNTSTAGLRHTEIGIHPKLSWFVPIGEKIELALSGGPSVIRVTHDVPAVTVTIASRSVAVTADRESGTAIGGNAGADLIYRATPRFGLGFFARYAGGRADLPSIRRLAVGGLQAGAGLRLRF
jgi:hypothetical protein